MSIIAKLNTLLIGRSFYPSNTRKKDEIIEVILDKEVNRLFLVFASGKKLRIKTFFKKLQYQCFKTRDSILKEFLKQYEKSASTFLTYLLNYDLSNIYINYIIDEANNIKVYDDDIAWLKNNIKSIRAYVTPKYHKRFEKEFPGQPYSLTSVNSWSWHFRIHLSSINDIPDSLRNLKNKDGGNAFKEDTKDIINTAFVWKLVKEENFNFTK